MNPLASIRREAQERGLCWSDVRAVYCELQEAEREKRERPNEVRETAWMLATASVPGCWPFWRHGFYSRWGRKLAKGDDYTCVPGYDEIGQGIATQFPEYADADGTERLFEFLFSPYEKLPTREEIYREAMDYVESNSPAAGLQAATATRWPNNRREAKERMMRRIEWRHNNGWEPILIIDDDSNQVVTYFDNGKALHDMLTGLGDLDDWEGEDPGDAVDPNDYGELVMSRGADGTVLEIDLDLFRARLAFCCR